MPSEDQYDSMEDSVSASSAVIEEQNVDGTNWNDDDFLSFGEKEGKMNPSASVPSKTKQMESKVDRPTGEIIEEDDLPPWMEKASYRNINPIIRLHNEITQFTRLVEPSLKEKQRRHDLVNRIRRLIQSLFDNATVEVFGSLATGLFLPSSDIDIVVQTEDESRRNGQTKANEEPVPGGPSDLQKVADALKDQWLPELSYLEVIENTRVPLVKFIHKPTEFKVDICFNQDKGVDAAKLILSFMKNIPPLKPLSFVLKYFLQVRALNEPYTGGLGSFFLQLMIVAFLQQREREGNEFQRPLGFNLGTMLLEFFEFYGTQMNYVTTGISVINNGSFFPKGARNRREIFLKEDRLLLLAMENPLDTTMDVGISTFRYQMIQRSFATAHKILLAHLTAPELSTMSFLATIFPQNDEELLKRRARASETSESLMLHRGNGENIKNCQVNKKRSSPRSRFDRGNKRNKRLTDAVV